MCHGLGMASVFRRTLGDGCFGCLWAPMRPAEAGVFGVPIQGMDTLRALQPGNGLQLVEIPLCPA